MPVSEAISVNNSQAQAISNAPLAYVYAALLVEKRAFERLSPEDQQVVREVMEGIYRKFDKYGVSENDEALQALLDNGLQMITPDQAEVREWQSIVNQSSRELAGKGVFDIELLDRIDVLLTEYRNDGAVASN